MRTLFVVFCVELVCFPMETVIKGSYVLPTIDTVVYSHQGLKKHLFPGLGI